MAPYYHCYLREDRSSLVEEQITLLWVLPPGVINHISLGQQVSSVSPMIAIDSLFPLTLELP
jgi:hypothetical protein